MTARQLSMFGPEEEVRPRRRRPQFDSVLWDPSVSQSRARSSELGCDLRSAFVSFWGRLPPERRAELRARLAA